jgi:hypothetical protein
MMYTEDLIILMNAMLLNKGYYYEWLDDKSCDIGDRIKYFVKGRKELQPSQWQKILSYVDPNSQLVEDIDRPIVKKLIDSNIEFIKKAFDYVIDFTESNIIASRRYKHAGLPIRLGYRFDGNPLTSGTKFESYSMISAGADPLTNVMPFPYSNNVIESYKILLPQLQYMISHIIRNKLECIARRVEGIIPKTYFSEGLNPYTLEEERKLGSSIDKFNGNNPIHLFDTDFHFLSTFDIKSLPWYTNLNQNLEKWKQIKKDAEEAKSNEKNTTI